MTKQDLIAWGLNEEQANKVMGGLDGDYVTKTRFNEVNEELKQQKAAIADRDKQLDDLKKSSGDNAELKKQIEQLQAANTEQKKAHDAEIAQLRLDNAIDSSLTAAGAKNLKAVRAMLDTSKMKLGDDGKVSGLDEAIAAVQKSDAYMFNVKQQAQNTFRGFQPGASDNNANPGTEVDTSKMTYSEMVSYLEQNPGATI